MNYYGAVFRIADLERWGMRVITLAQDPHFAADAEIWTAIATAASCAIAYLGRADSQWELYRRRYIDLLALSARRFPGNAAIQASANPLGLTYASQAARGWPHGSPERDA